MHSVASVTSDPESVQNDARKNSNSVRHQAFVQFCKSTRSIVTTRSG